MRFLCNENIPIKSVHILRDNGLDVIAISEDSPGTQDEEILKKAHQTNSIIITFDRDYGELIFKRNLPSPKGIIFLRFIPKSPGEPAQYILRLLEREEITIEGYFTVGESDQIRQRKLPTGS